jgi:SAM-dependent methyltransferase
VFGAIPTPLDDDWLATLDLIAREARLPSVSDPRFPELVAAMAAVYNDDRLAGLRGARAKEQLAARLGFWFPRDVPKVAGAVREAIALGRPSSHLGAVHVLDVGAGLGASHRGLARALSAAGRSERLEVLALDDDEAALRLASAIVANRPREGDLEIRLRTQTASFGSIAARPPRGPWDVILVGQVLSELDRDLPEAERIARHVEALAAFSKVLAPQGILVVVEPALRPRARHLQALRGPLVEAGLSIVAPCLHEGRCPLLGREADWCHDDLPVDLPDGLVPVAKRAGLRWQGLTFGYLVLSRRGAKLADLPGERRERAVSGLLVSKGKREIVLCGDPLRGAVEEGDPLGPHGARIGRLDRARSDANGAFDELARGDLLTLDPLDDKARLGVDSMISKLVE